ncbi:MAG: hypothetical protein O2890_11300 [Cyanobacteria bacterium]|nr:hypothetical protein [Cyanobacteriota bacterium]
MQTESVSTPRTFAIAPLIRITLLTFYIALTLPLPFLAAATAAPLPSPFLWAAMGVGGLGLYGALSEQVQVDADGIHVGYPFWIRWVLRRGWTLPWQRITALKPRSTGQGGLVYYLVGDDQQAYLLPMRVSGFAQLTRYIQAHTDIDLQDVKPLAQPWMYLILLGCAVLLLGVDGWVLWAAAHLG